MTPVPTDTGELVHTLDAAFAGRTTIGVPELAALIPMHRETIARHTAAGSLVGRLKGLGRTRRHRVFTIDDAIRFLQSITDGSRRSTCQAIQAGNSPVRLAHGMNITLPSKRGEGKRLR